MTLHEAAKAVVDEWDGDYDGSISWDGGQPFIDALRAALAADPEPGLREALASDPLRLDPDDAASVERLAKAMAAAYTEENAFYGLTNPEYALAIAREWKGAEG